MDEYVRQAEQYSLSSEDLTGQRQAEQYSLSSEDLTGQRQAEQYSLFTTDFSVQPPVQSSNDQASQHGLPAQNTKEVGQCAAEVERRSQEAGQSAIEAEQQSEEAARPAPAGSQSVNQVDQCALPTDQSAAEIMEPMDSLAAAEESAIEVDFLASEDRAPPPTDAEGKSMQP